MNLRWLWLDHVPAGLTLTPEQRREARRLARSIKAENPAFAGARRKATITILLWTVLWIAGVIAYSLHHLWFPWKPKAALVSALSTVAAVLILNGSIWVIIAMSVNRAAAPFMRAALSLMGFATCVPCGYLLKGLAPGEACPECGTVPTPVPRPTIDPADKRLKRSCF